MPYSKNIANSFSVSNFPNQSLNVMHQMAENNRYSVPSRPQMIINSNPFFSQNGLFNRNQNRVMPNNPQQVNNSLQPHINLMQSGNQNLSSQIAFNPMIPMMNRCFANFINIQGQLAMNNLQNIKQQNNLHFQNPLINTSKGGLENKSELLKTSFLNAANTKELNLNNFEIPKARELLQITNDKKQNTKSDSNTNALAAESKPFFNEPYGLNERSNSKASSDRKKGFTNTQVKNKSKKLLKDNDSEFDDLDKENNSSHANKMLGNKRNQHCDSAKENKFNDPKERNLKKIKHS